MKNNYLNVISSIERIHRLFLEVIDCELIKLKITDINSTQALLLYNIGEKVLSVGEISARGYYLGTNVSYNLKKITTAGYIEQNVATYDRRSSLIKLSKRGLQLYKTIDSAIIQQSNNIRKESTINLDELANTLGQVEIFFGKTVLQSSRTMMPN